MRGDPLRAVSQLRRERGKDIIVIDGPSVAQAFMSKGLVDDYFLNIYPVLFGEGKPLFGDFAKQQTLRRVAAKQYKSGEVVLHYETLHGKNY
jgi:dihydrofolate reductase